MKSFNMSLTVIGRYPDSISEREGMSQRIKAVDTVMEQHTRTYLEFYPQRNWFLDRNQIDEKLRVIRGNTLLHLPLAVYCMVNSQLTYVHSVYNALQILPMFKVPGLRIVVDLHGIVPEEEILLGRKGRATLLSYAESVVVRHAQALITVSEAMSRHLIEKYPYLDLQSKLLKVPIMDLYENEEMNISSLEMFKKGKGKKQVVYAGGIQRWQNIETVLQTVASIHTNAPGQYDFSIFVPAKSLDAVKKMAEKFRIGEVEIDSLPHGQVMERYKMAHMGFILREDIAVNRVAMPTKLVEYLKYGLVPVVLSPNLGDYPHYGYEWLELRSWMNDPSLSQYSLEKMRQKNYQVVQHIRQDAQRALLRLKELLGPAR